MKELVFVHPGDLGRPTGGYAYDRRMIAGLCQLGWKVSVIGLPGTYPMPSAADLVAAARAFAAIPDNSLVVIDGLAYGALPDIARRHRARLSLVALVHHPLAHETGLAKADATRLRESEFSALQCARAVITTGRATARTLSDEYAVKRDAITLAEPGIEHWGRAPCRGAPPVLLSMGALISRKAHDVLLQALAEVVDLPWRCRIVGDEKADPGWSSALKGQAEKYVPGRVEFTGISADPRSDFLEADLFVLPSRYEGYGMAFAEALACGLPVVGCPVGALPEILPPEAGKLVAIGDVAALSAVLRDLLSDPDRRDVMAEAAFEAGRKLPDWQHTARRISDALVGLVQ